MASYPRHNRGSMPFPVICAPGFDDARSEGAQASQLGMDASKPAYPHPLASTLDAHPNRWPDPPHFQAAH